MDPESYTGDGAGMHAEPPISPQPVADAEEEGEGIQPAPLQPDPPAADIFRRPNHAHMDFSKGWISSISMGAVLTLVALAFSNGMSLQAILTLLAGSGVSIHVVKHRIATATAAERRLRHRRSSQFVLNSNDRGVSSGAEVVFWSISMGGALVTVYFLGGGFVTFGLSLLGWHRITNTLITRYLDNLTQEKLLETRMFFRRVGITVENALVLRLLKQWLENAAPSRYKPPSRPGESVRRAQLQERGVDYISMLAGLITFGLTYSRFEWSWISAYTGLSFATIRSAMLLYLYLMRRARVAQVMDDLRARRVTDPNVIAETLALNAYLATRGGDNLADSAVMFSRTVDVVRFVPLALVARMLPDRARAVILGFIGSATVAAAIQWRTAAEAVADGNVEPENVINYVYDNSPFNRGIRALLYSVPFILFYVAIYALVRSETGVSAGTLAAPFFIGALALTGILFVLIYMNITSIDSAILRVCPIIKKSHRCMVLCGRSEGHTQDEQLAEVVAEVNIARTLADIQADRARIGAAGVDMVTPPPPDIHPNSFTGRAREWVRDHIRRRRQSDVVALADMAIVPPEALYQQDVPAGGEANFRLEPVGELVGDVGRYRLAGVQGQDGRLISHDIIEVVVNHAPSMDGRVTLLHRNGYRTEVFPDGLQEIHHPDQGFMALHPDGRVTRHPVVVVQEPVSDRHVVIDMTTLEEERDPDAVSIDISVNAVDDVSTDGRERDSVVVEIDPPADGGVDSGSDTSSGNSGASMGSNWAIFPQGTPGFANDFQDKTPEILDLFSGFYQSLLEEGFDLETYENDEEDQEKRATVRIVGIEEEEEEDVYDEDEEWYNKRPETPKKIKTTDEAMPEYEISEKLVIHPKTYEHFAQEDDVTRSSWIEGELDIEDVVSIPSVQVLRAKSLHLSSFHYHHTPVMSSFSSFHHHDPMHLKAPLLAGGLHSVFHAAGIHFGS